MFHGEEVGSVAFCVVLAHSFSLAFPYQFSLLFLAFTVQMKWFICLGSIGFCFLVFIFVSFSFVTLEGGEWSVEGEIDKERVQQAPKTCLSFHSHFGQ